MLKSSFLAQSRQLWKLNAGLGSIGLGLLVVFGLVNSNATAEVGVIGVVGGLVLCLSGMIYVFASIRCPRCRERVLWTAARSQVAGQWLRDLLQKPSCPRCGFEPATSFLSGRSP